MLLPPVPPPELEEPALDEVAVVEDVGSPELPHPAARAIVARRTVSGVELKERMADHYHGALSAGCATDSPFSRTLTISGALGDTLQK